MCIGTGDGNSDKQAALVSRIFKMQYHGVFDKDTVKQSGLYHTSTYDIKPEELKSKLDPDDAIIIFDLSISDFPNKDEYFQTLGLAESLPDTVSVNYLNESIRNSFYKIIKENKSFCILPFIEIHQNENLISNCCLMDPYLTDTNLYTDFNTDFTMVNIREQMRNGVMVGNCKNCYQLEEIGAPSTRQQSTIEWTNRLNIKSIPVVGEEKLVKYDIRLNNECNAMCRTCSPEYSNLIDREYYKIKIVNESIGLRKDTSYDSIDLDMVQQLYVAGGEPTINKYFIDFLYRCIGQEKTEIELVINTNAAVISERFIDAISHFRNVKFEISIDAFGELNHYIRYPISWSKFTSNVDLLNRISNGKISFNSVISIYNGGMLFPLFEFLQKNYGHAMTHISILSNPLIQQIQNFPDKKAAILDLEKVKTLPHYKKHTVFRESINSLISIIEKSSIDAELLSKFFTFNDKLDESRNMSLHDYNPILYKARDMS